MRNTTRGRFRVWDRAQDSFNGDDLVFNFDTIDSIIGGPDGYSGSSGSAYTGSASTWLGNNDIIPNSSGTKYPGTTNGGYENQTGRRSFYSVVSGLNYNDVPLGTVIQWWRPTADIQIPDGWMPCDGSTVSQSDHSFPLPGSITLPDLRNKMVIGADANVSGINAFNGYALHPNAQPASNTNNLWSGGLPQAPGTTGAPGVGYDSGLEPPSLLTGTNRLRSIDHRHNSGDLKITDHYHGIAHTHTVKSHWHDLAPHTHDFSHVHMIPDHIHSFNFSDDFNVSTPVNFSGDGTSIRVREVANAFDGQRFATPSHSHTVKISKAGSTGTRSPITEGNNGLQPNGPGSAPWPYSEPGMGSFNSITFASGTHAAYTSLATSYGIDPGSRRFNATQVKRNTGGGARTSGGAFDTTEPSGEMPTVSLKDNQNRTSGQASDGIIVANNVSVDDQMKVTGLTSMSGQNAINTRLQYVGLLYLIKVKVSTNVI